MGEPEDGGFRHRFVQHFRPHEVPEGGEDVVEVRKQVGTAVRRRDETLDEDHLGLGRVELAPVLDDRVVLHDEFVAFDVGHGLRFLPVGRMGPVAVKAQFRRCLGPCCCHAERVVRRHATPRGQVPAVAPDDRLSGRIAAGNVVLVEVPGALCTLLVFRPPALVVEPDAHGVEVILRGRRQQATFRNIINVRSRRLRFDCRPNLFQRNEFHKGSLGFQFGWRFTLCSDTHHSFGRYVSRMGSRSPFLA